MVFIALAVQSGINGKRIGSPERYGDPLFQLALRAGLWWGLKLLYDNYSIEFYTSVRLMEC